jgi:hypothetical protein
MIPGIKDRFYKDITSQLGESFAKDFKIISSSLNANLPVIGGILMTQTNDFSNLCLTKEEYEKIESNKGEILDWFEVWFNKMERQNKRQSRIRKAIKS